MCCLLLRNFCYNTLQSCHCFTASIVGAFISIELIQAIPTKRITDVPTYISPNLFTIADIIVANACTYPTFCNVRSWFLILNFFWNLVQELFKRWKKIVVNLWRKFYVIWRHRYFISYSLYTLGMGMNLLY